MDSIKFNGGSELNFSDVIDVIEHDPDYTEKPSDASASLKAAEKAIKKIESAMSAAEGEIRPQKPQVKILEQPASIRFRYECEGRLAGSIPGVNSTADNKTYPTIQVIGHRGKAVVVVSCVTKDFPYKPHPHSLVGKDGCKKGVCTLEINNENMICTFSNMGIQCVKKKGIDEALKLREEIRVDPFQTGFAHRSQPQSIDLNVVRLCFQVFIEGKQRGKFNVALNPVVTEPIFDKKAMWDLTICKLSDCNSPVNGGKEIIMLCDKVTKDDIEILFYREEEGRVVWEAQGEFTASDVHKQCAISFRTPCYKDLNADEPIATFVQLRRPSDGKCSEPRPFQYLPLDSGSVNNVEGLYSSCSVFANKRFKPDFELYSHILATDAVVLARRMFRASDEYKQTEDESRSTSNFSVQCCLPQETVTTNKSVAISASTQTGFNHDSPGGPLREAPPLPEKGPGFAKLKRNLVNSSENSLSPNPNKPQKVGGKSVNFDRSSLSTIISETESDPRFSVASSEDLNSRLSAAFSDYSDLTDVRSVVDSEPDINDALSLISSVHTLNDRLSQVSDASDVSDQTVIDGSKSETNSIDTIEKQLEMLESMSLDVDAQTYSSFQMAMKHPIYARPTRLNPTEESAEKVENDQVYDDPDDADQAKVDAVPVVPLRVESKALSTPPLPPRRFKKMNQPLPDLPPSKDHGLKSALQALKQTFMKAKPIAKADSRSSNIGSSQESVREVRKATITDTQADPEKTVVTNSSTISGVSGEQPATAVVDADANDNLTEAENFALYMTVAPIATASEFDDNETLSMMYADITPNPQSVEVTNETSDKK